MVDFNKVGKLIIASLQKELIEQGHQATGNLVNSFEQRVIEVPNSIVIEILMDEYGIYVNEGRAKKKKSPLLQNYGGAQQNAGLGGARGARRHLGAAELRAPDGVLA